ncbi:MAG: hypothetical protein EXR95_04355 [Gemmatimonadetes bacterium]|nr:hypothetical protein [Gemmatimonadota bacterium]
MKIRALLLLALTLPGPVLAQDTTAAAAQVAPEPPPPSGLAAAEIARSRRCVPVLAKLDTLNARLKPLADRADHIRMLNEAVLVEDSTRADTLDAADPVDAAVRAWFASDQMLAKQYAESGDSAIEARRAEGRDQIRRRLGEAISAVNASGRELIETAGDLELGTRECQGMMLVRSSVLEACGSADTPLCADAREPEPKGRYGLVDRPEDVWDFESIRPWEQPTPLGSTQAGGLAGAQTAAVAQRGNMMVVLSVEPMIRDRADVGAAEAALLEANLDSLGITHRNAKYLVVPALSVEIEVAEPLGGETHYFLHFGDLSNPGRDVIWTSPAIGHPQQGTIPATKAVLDRLAAGEGVTLTAIRFPDPAQKQAEALYSVELTEVGQALAVSMLLEYLKTDFGADFDALLPAGAD